MVTTAELENILYRQNNQIDKQHIYLFLGLINELKV